MIGGPEQNTALVVDANGLAAADRLLRPADVVAARRQIVLDRGRYRRFQREHAVEREGSRRLGGRLDVEAEIKNVGNQVGVAGGLIVPAHHAERHHRASILHHQAGNDGVHRPLAGPERIEVPRLGAKAPAAVVQQHAGLRRIDAATEWVEQRVDQGNRIEVAVDDRDVDGVAVLDIVPRFDG